MEPLVDNYESLVAVLIAELDLFFQRYFYFWVGCWDEIYIVDDFSSEHPMVFKK